LEPFPFLKRRDWYAVFICVVNRIGRDGEQNRIRGFNFQRINPRETVWQFSGIVVTLVIVARSCHSKTNLPVHGEPMTKDIRLAAQQLVDAG